MTKHKYSAMYHIIIKLDYFFQLQDENDPTAVLWYQEIQDTVNAANTHGVEGGHCKL